MFKNEVFGDVDCHTLFSKHSEKVIPCTSMAFHIH